MGYPPPTPPPFQQGPPQWQPSQSPQWQPSQPSYGNRIQLCQDGKYRWIYEFSMMKNPMLFITIYKVICLSCLIVWLLLNVISLFSGDFPDTVWTNTKIVLLIFAIFAVLVPFAYLIVAAQNGWKYVVLFEMDDKEIIHRQMNKQVKKAKAIGWLTVLAGLVGGSRGAVSAGIVAATHTTTISTFHYVKKVKPYRKWNTIKVNQPLSKNQVYADIEDFDWLYQYIVSHCPKVKW